MATIRDLIKRFLAPGQQEYRAIRAYVIANRGTDVNDSYLRRILAELVTKGELEAEGHYTKYWQLSKNPSGAMESPPASNPVITLETEIPEMAEKIFKILTSDKTPNNPVFASIHTALQKGVNTDKLIESLENSVIALKLIKETQ